jgi:putative molybdopterin biosynthesis protein
LETISELDQFKALGHPFRFSLLRHLMSQPATLSQLGEYFHESPAHIRHHLIVLEEACLVEYTSEIPLQNHLEKYYQATSNAWLVILALLPETPDQTTPVVIGSKDLVTHRLASYFRQKKVGIALQIISLNSIDGLLMLRQGVCQMTTCHLREPETGTYNRPYVRHIFPGQKMAIAPLYQREEGLILPVGNPKGIRRLEDLTRPDVHMMNREKGAGIRVWLDQSLEEMGIPSTEIQGYDRVVYSHTEVAQSIQEGKADVGLGVAASAYEKGLDFIPLLAEPYELAFSSDLISDVRYTPFFEYLNTNEFQQTIQNINGYLVSANAGQIELVNG